jgi:ATP-dependent Clp protease ATP-binding subunit ClpC
MGSHHLLEALARSPDALAGKVLAALGVDADTLAATIDELGIEGTTDVTPEEAAARQMEVRVDGDELHIVLRDDATVALARSMTERLGGPLHGNDAVVGPLVGLWQPIVSALEELRKRLAPDPEDTETQSSRPSLVRQAIQSRLSRRRRDR